MNGVPSQYPASPEWLALQSHVHELASLLGTSTIDTLAVAKAFARVAKSLHAATAASGESSLRFDAVVKALDLTTPKSALKMFVNSGT